MLSVKSEEVYLKYLHGFSRGSDGTQLLPLLV